MKGSSFDDFLRDEGVLEETDARVAKRIEGDLKPRGVKTPMCLIPWEVVPIEFIPPILCAAIEPVSRKPNPVIAFIARETISIVGIEAVARAFEYGASKYGIENWKTAVWDDEAKREYFSAMCRHLVARHRGEGNAPDSGIDHYAHAAAGALIYLWHESR